MQKLSLRSVSLTSFFTLILLLTLAGPLRGQTTSNWIDTTGNWSNPANWDNGVPNGNYNAFVGNGNSVPPITANLDINTTVDNLTLGGMGSLSLANGVSLTTSQNLSVDYGLISVSGGSSINVGGTLTSPSQGNITVDGSSFSANSAFVGGGNLTIQNGASFTTQQDFGVQNVTLVNVLSGSSLNVGGNLASQGLITVDASSLNVNGSVTLEYGAQPVSSLAIQDGAALGVQGNMTLGPGVSNVFTVSGGSSATINGNLNMNYPGTDNVTIDSGVLTVKGSVNTGPGPTGNALSVANGSVLNVGSSLTIEGVGNASPTFQITGGSAATVNGMINNSGSILIDGTSVLNARGGLVQTGGSTVAAGVLNVGQNGANIQGGTLSGTGIVNGNVTMTGTMAPGNATGAGTFTINGNYTQTSAGTLMETYGLLNGTNGSLLQINGTADLNGTLSLSLPNGCDPTVGATFTLMTFFNEDGSFNTITGLNLGNNEHLDVFYDPHDIRAQVESAFATPEPGSAMLCLIGLAAMFVGFWVSRAVRA